MPRKTDEELWQEALAAGTEGLPPPPPLTGALPPPGLEWIMGKTAPSVKFVNDAHRAVSSMSNPNDKAALEDAVDRIKKGELVLNEWTNVHDFIQASHTSP